MKSFKHNLPYLLSWLGLTALLCVAAYALNGDELRYLMYFPLLILADVSYVLVFGWKKYRAGELSTKAIKHHLLAWLVVAVLIYVALFSIDPRSLLDMGVFGYVSILCLSVVVIHLFKLKHHRRW